jgi:hypothetical protein
MKNDHNVQAKNESSGEESSNGELSTKMDLGSVFTPVKWKCHNVFVVRDFLPILGAHNPCLGTERRCEITAHMSCVANEYAEMGCNEI